MIKPGNEIIGAVIGPSKCGKTTLAMAIALKMWRLHKLRCIVYDPFKYKNVWPFNCWVTDDLDKFKAVVFKTKGCCIIWDESSDTLNPKKDRQFFTRIRHEHKASYVITHDLKFLDPNMRANMMEIYVFRQLADRAKEFAYAFSEEAFLDLCNLARRGEFYFMASPNPAVRMFPTLEELKCLQ